MILLYQLKSPKACIYYATKITNIQTHNSLFSLQNSATRSNNLQPKGYIVCAVRINLEVLGNKSKINCNTEKISLGNKI